MSKLIILGSSNAIPHKDHENTHMVIVGSERTVLVDCVGNPILRLERAGVDFNTITDLILTHFHPDHVSGVPLLLMDMWLMGRKRQLNVYGLHATLDRVENLMGFYEWGRWPEFFPTAFKLAIFQGKSTQGIGPSETSDRTAAKGIICLTVTRGGSRPGYG